MSAKSRSALLAALPYLVFAALYAATFERWVLPFQDAGREVLTAVRVLQGDVLYRDVVDCYGPLSPLLDAAALRVLGLHLGSFFALRTLLALLGVEGIRRLARRLAPTELTASAVAALVVSACFFFPAGGAYPFPYSAGTLEGTVGTWWALELALGSTSPFRSVAAAVVAGIAASGKVEYGAVALAGPLLALFLRRPRGEAAAAAAVAAGIAILAYTVPWALVGTVVMREHGFLIAADAPESWRRLYRLLFWGGGTAADFLAGRGARLLLPSALVVGAVSLAVSRLPDRPALRGLLFAGGLATAALPGALALHALLPAAAVVVVREALRLARGRAAETGGLRGAEGISFLCVGASMLPALARQPFSMLTTAPYAAFSAPLALAVSLSFLARSAASPGLLAAFVLGVSTAQAADRARWYHTAPRELVVHPRARLWLYPAEARLLRESVEAFRRTPPGAFVGAFPEGGLIIFLADRRSPFASEQFFPGSQTIRGEEEMIRALRATPLSAAVVLGRNMVEFGYTGFGRGYLESFSAELERAMRPASTLGAPATEWPPGMRATRAILYLPREAAAAPPP